MTDEQKHNLKYQCGLIKTYVRKCENGKNFISDLQYHVDQLKKTFQQIEEKKNEK